MTPIDQKPGAKQVSWMSANIGPTTGPTFHPCVASLPVTANPAGATEQRSGLCPLSAHTGQFGVTWKRHPHEERSHSSVPESPGPAADVGRVT